MFDLSGRVALVTGGGQNIGAGIAHALAGQGATVVVNDLIAERANSVADSVDGVPAPFDVTDLEAVVAGVTAIGRPVDILVNNAGNSGGTTGRIAPFVDLDPSEWEGPIRVNLYGVMHCCKAVVPGMLQRGWGRVITVCSLAGTGGIGWGLTPYSAGKGGGLGFTRSLALEVGRSGVTANCVAPGFVARPDQPGPNVTGLALDTPVGRVGTPQDIAAACVWLASEEASWVTGQTIEINGGVRTT